MQNCQITHFIIMTTLKFQLNKVEDLSNLFYILGILIHLIGSIFNPIGGLLGKKLMTN